MKFSHNTNSLDEYGVFGKVKAYFGAVESQSTTNLHAHFLIWISGVPSNKSGWIKAINDNACKYVIEEYASKVVKANYPLPSICPECKHLLQSLPLDEKYFEKGTNSPEPPIAKCLSCMKKWSTNQIFKTETIINLSDPIAICSTNLNQLTGILLKVQTHDHNHRKSCFKKSAINFDSNKCRFKFPQSTNNLNTYLNEDGLEIYRPPGCNYLNTYNEQILQCLHCNHDVKLILGNGAVTMCYYILKYTSKLQQKIENEQNIALMAFNKKFNEKPNCTKAGFARLASVIYKLNSFMEIPATMVMHYILSENPFYISHKMATLNIKQSLNYLNKVSTNVWINEEPDGNYYFVKPLDNYMLRPNILSNVCYYEFVRNFTMEPYKSNGLFHFKDTHPLSQLKQLKKIKYERFVMVQGIIH